MNAPRTAIIAGTACCAFLSLASLAAGVHDNSRILHVKIAPDSDVALLSAMGTVSPLFTLSQKRLRKLGRAQEGLPDLTLWHSVSVENSSALGVVEGFEAARAIVEYVVYPESHPSPADANATTANVTDANATVADAIIANATVVNSTAFDFDAIIANATVASTTVASTTVSSTTVASTTVSSTTVASTTVPSTTISSTTVSSTTVTSSTVANETAADFTVAKLTTVDPIPVPALNQVNGHLLRNDDDSNGIDAEYSWTFPGGDGAGVTIYDVEYAWSEDMASPVLLPDGDASENPFGEDAIRHGTASLDTVSGISGGAGTGLAPERTSLLGSARANAILLAANAGKAGDVILLSAQVPACGLGRYGPAENDPSVFDATRVAVANGLVVVAAAGNGDVDLDDVACNGRYDRSFRDSGAVVVGAGGSGVRGCGQVGRTRMEYSTYGERVDVQGWGECIDTLGGGYRDGFGGTSGAAALVAAAAANLQGIAIQQFGAPRDPLEIRKLLKDTGVAQEGNVTKSIGPLVNLRAAVDALLTQSAFLAASDRMSLPTDRKCCKRDQDDDDDIDDYIDDDRSKRSSDSWDYSWDLDSSYSSKSQKSSRSKSSKSSKSKDISSSYDCGDDDDDKSDDDKYDDDKYDDYTSSSSGKSSKRSRDSSGYSSNPSNSSKSKSSKSSRCDRTICLRYTSRKQCIKNRNCEWETDSNGSNSNNKKRNKKKNRNKNKNKNDDDHYVVDGYCRRKDVDVDSTFCRNISGERQCRQEDRCEYDTVDDVCRSKLGSDTCRNISGERQCRQEEECEYDAVDDVCRSKLGFDTCRNISGERQCRQEEGCEYDTVDDVCRSESNRSSSNRDCRDIGNKSTCLNTFGCGYNGNRCFNKNRTNKSIMATCAGENKKKCKKSANCSWKNGECIGDDSIALSSRVGGWEGLVMKQHDMSNADGRARMSTIFGCMLVAMWYRWS